MKKLIIFAISLILLLSDFGLSICLAEEDAPNPWIVDSYTAIANINPDGSMDVEEYVTYKFTKGFDGTLKRQIDTFAASGIDNISIYNAVDLDEDNITESKLEQLKSDSYEVVVNEEYGMVSGMDISLDPEDKQRTLVYRYTLYDLVGVYSDMALLDWSFLNKVDNPSVENISISVKIPKGGDMEAIQSFLLGPLYTQQVKGENTVGFEASLLDHGRDLKLVLLLPTSVISEGRKKIDNEIAQKVLADMEEYENEIGIVRKEYETRKLTITLLTYITAGLIAIALIYIYIRHNRDPKTGIKSTYTNELPADYYTPAELGILMNRGRIRANYIIATLMDLVNRGYLNIESSEDDGFILSKNLDAKMEQLKGHEEYLLVWVFDDFGQGSIKVSTKQFEEWIKDADNKTKYKHKYKTWQKLVMDQASKWKFFEDVKKAKLYGLLLGFLTTISGIAVCILGDMVKGLIVIGLSLLLMIYSQLIQKRTEFGAVNNAKWNGFKKYLRDPSQSNLPKPEPDAWEKFLAYAIAIDGTEDIMSQFPKVYGDSGLNNKKLFLLHKDNLHRTIHWINSMGRNHVTEGKISGAFRFSGSTNITIDKKG